MYYEIGKLYKSDIETHTKHFGQFFLLVGREECHWRYCDSHKCKGRLVGVGRCPAEPFCGYIVNDDLRFNIVLDSTLKQNVNFILNPSDSNFLPCDESSL